MEEEIPLPWEPDDYDWKEDGIVPALEEEDLYECFDGDLSLQK